jgi:K(+)-stimulated pyrophosphate-energized sodium pump
MLGGYMAGVTVSGVLWAIFQNNAGGAWDNAKKSFEAGVLINGEMTYKGSDAHKAAVTGDTVGDPFKDTSGPSMNILIKLTCLIGLVIAPILGGHTTTDVVAKETSSEEVYFIDAEGNKTILTEKQVQYLETGSTIAEGEDLNNKTETMVEMLKNDTNDQVTANVTITRTVDGVETIETKTFTGTEEEVRAQLKDVDGMKIKVKDKE